MSFLNLQRPIEPSTVTKQAQPLNALQPRERIVMICGAILVSAPTDIREGGRRSLPVWPW